VTDLYPNLAIPTLAQAKFFGCDGWIGTAALMMHLLVMGRAEGCEILWVVQATLCEAMDVMHLKPASVGASCTLRVSVRALVLISDSDLMLAVGWDMALGFGSLS
jgi:hypothetical protein